MSNTFGTFLKLTTFGESHGVAVGAVIDGAPPGLALSKDAIDAELARRRPGQSDLVTPRNEPDTCEILSGVHDGRTLGTPIAVIVRNSDARPEAYGEIRAAYRPSHADFTWEKKFGTPPVSGGGRASARETIGRVIGGVVARRILATFAPIEIVAYVRSVAAIEATVDASRVTRAAVEATAVRCPDAAAAERMAEAIKAASAESDSLGGVIECVVRGVPAGWGDPVFEKLTATLAGGLASIPAVRGVEFGAGFAATRMKGSEHNDAFVIKDGAAAGGQAVPPAPGRAPFGGAIGTATNRSGGIQGGISNGEPIVLRVAFKPVATIGKRQETVTRDGKETTLEAKGRHDPCVLPRAVPIVEAMVALALADHALRQRAIR
jgi:chorismate synthase